MKVPVDYFQRKERFSGGLSSGYRHSVCVFAYCPSLPRVLLELYCLKVLELGNAVCIR